MKPAGRMRQANHHTPHVQGCDACATRCRHDCRPQMLHHWLCPASFRAWMGLSGGARLNALLGDQWRGPHAAAGDTLVVLQQADLLQLEAARAALNTTRRCRRKSPWLRLVQQVNRPPGTCPFGGGAELPTTSTRLRKHAKRPGFESRRYQGDGVRPRHTSTTHHDITHL